MWKICLVAAFYCSTALCQNVAVEYYPQNIQYQVTTMVPVTTVVHQQVWVPIIRAIPIQYLVPVQIQSIHRGCLGFDRWNDPRVQNNYWVTPYRIYNY
jgi:hypothetical protein